MSILVENDWWVRDDLKTDGDQLWFAGHRASELAYRYGTPSFFYSPKRVFENIGRVRSALQSAGFADRYRIHFAMKANRFLPLLTLLKTSGEVGIDACSPNEVERAISCGFQPSDISLTANSLTPGEHETLCRLPGLKINCDSVSSISRWGELRPGSSIGIRVNPEIGVGRAANDKLHYSGQQTTKFGIYREQFQAALQEARRHQLKVRTIHFHTGCGYLNDRLASWDEAIAASHWFIDQCSDLESVNVGGGLGVPHSSTDQPLCMNTWGQILAKHFADTSLTVEVEPGDYLVKDAGLLLTSVGCVERKKDTLFVGLNAGFNLAVEPAFYSLPFQPVATQTRPGDWQPTTIVGNINEALDVWYHQIQFPPVEEEDTVAILNAGAYSASMASNHCMRGDFKEFLI
ncbi:MAG: diaminopimelate decarboxylase [Pirellulaceae bacterium]|jgi:diaminopimelate decarboxylase